MPCVNHWFVGLLSLSLFACAHKAPQFPLAELDDQVGALQLTNYSEASETPVITINGVAYVLNNACYDTRFYDYQKQTRRYQMNNEDRAYSTSQQNRDYESFEEQRLYEQIMQARLYDQYRLDRDYLVQTEERIHQAFNENRNYLQNAQNRRYAVFNAGLFCSPDDTKAKVRIMREDSTPLVGYRYYYLGQSRQADKGYVLLD